MFTISPPSGLELQEAPLNSAPHCSVTAPETCQVGRSAFRRPRLAQQPLCRGLWASHEQHLGELERCQAIEKGSRDKETKGRKGKHVDGNSFAALWRLRLKLHRICLFNLLGAPGLTTRSKDATSWITVLDKYAFCITCAPNDVLILCQDSVQPGPR